MIKYLYRRRWPGLPIRVVNRLLTSALVGKGHAYRKPGIKLEKIGSDYGGWVVPVDRINATTICYCGGVGEDISFDLGLIEKFGCNVFAFDPTPRSISFIENNSMPEKFHFFAWGLWDRETTLKFFEPENPSHVSHSVVNLQKTGNYFEAVCKPVSAIADELGHKSVGLIKIDIEGAEFAVIGDIIWHGIKPEVLCVEFDQPCSPFRIYRAVQDIVKSGLELIAVDHWNYTFAKAS